MMQTYDSLFFPFLSVFQHNTYILLCWLKLLRLKLYMIWFVCITFISILMLPMQVYVLVLKKSFFYQFQAIHIVHFEECNCYSWKKLYSLLWTSKNWSLIDVLFLKHITIGSFWILLFWASFLHHIRGTDNM